MLKDKLEDGCQDKNYSAIITRENIEDFCNAIVDSPELYPYFMGLGPDGLLRKCNKMASYITDFLNKNIITPADTQFLKKIHNSLNINETSYDEFTRLFAHICCRNNSDYRRKKMLSIFSILKAHICPAAGSGENFAAFCEVISNLHPVDWKEMVDREKGCSWQNSFPELSTNCFFKPGADIWNEEAQYFHLRKRLRKCEKLITVIQYKSKRMEMRIAKLEKKCKRDQIELNQHRDLDLVYK